MGVPQSTSQMTENYQARLRQAHKLYISDPPPLPGQQPSPTVARSGTSGYHQAWFGLSFGEYRLRYVDYLREDVQWLRNRKRQGPRSARHHDGEGDNAAKQYPTIAPTCCTVRCGQCSSRGYTSDWAIRWSGSGDADYHETKAGPTVPLRAQAAKVLAVRQGVHLGASRRAYLSEVQGEHRMERVI